MGTQKAQIAILAGGFGTRLGSLTQHCPKAMLPVAGKPFLGYMLELIASQNFQRVHLCLGHLNEKICNYVQDGARWNLKVSYSIEEAPLGTAGCLRLASPYLEDTFITLYGDSLTPISISEVIHHQVQTGLPAVMVVLKNCNWLLPSNVAVENGHVVLYEKNSKLLTLEYTNYGILVFQKIF